MPSTKSLGRTIGLLLLAQLAGLIVPFVLLLPLARGSAEFHALGAAFSTQIKLAVVLLFLNGALTVGISVLAFPLFRQSSHSLAVLLIVASGIMLTLQAVDNAHILSLLSLSQQYALAGGPDELFRTLTSAISSTRRWIHHSELLAIDAWILLLYSILFRFALVPRALVAFGLVTVLLHFTGIILATFIGYSPVTLMGASMALGHLVLFGWLVSKGFHEPPLQLGAANGAQ